MWSLSVPQVAATLAAALVAYSTTNSAGERLINEPVLNAVIVLLVVTSVLGPILTQIFAKELPMPPDPGVLGEHSAVVVKIPLSEHHTVV